MPEQAITKNQIITVNEVGQNSYGDLTFTDKAGGQYKVSAKRKQYFEKIVTPGTAVQLNYAMSTFGKEYIYSAVQVSGQLLPPQQPVTPPTQHGEVVQEAVKLGAKVTSVETNPRYKADPAKTESIERQSALKSAVEWCIAKVQAGVDIKTTAVIKVAYEFLEFIENR